MNTPPFLLGATLVFWGWQTGFLWVGSVMAVILECSRVVKSRWEFSAAEFNRVWDLCSLIFVGALVYSYNSTELSKAVLAFVQWLPMVFFLFMVVQAYNSHDKIPLATFFLLLRRKGKTEGISSEINVSYPFFALCLVSTSAGNVRDVRFYIGSCILAGWALWQTRPRRAHSAWSIAFLLAVIGGGYLTQNGLHELQRVVESQATAWIAQLGPRDFDVRESRTAMGQIGKLKLSGKIILRVEPRDPLKVPALLRQVSYTQLKDTTWYALGKEFSPVEESPPSEWQLSESKDQPNSTIISCYLKGGRGLLSLPLGAERLVDLPVSEVEKNRLGAVRASRGPGVVRFRVDYGPGPTFDGPPDSDDLIIPPKEKTALSEIADELSLRSKSPEEVLSRLAEFFQSKFTYSMYLGGNRQDPKRPMTPLSSFLLKVRSGHCEYFASATVLLLRHLGIPARYATGFSVQGPSRNGVYLVRERHAHAWTLAYVAGQWRDLDTTPSSWDQVEEKNASIFEPLSDWWSGLWFKFSLWRWLGKSRLSTYLIWLLLPFIAFLAWRIFWRQKRTQLSGQGEQPLTKRNWIGLDSEFYLIEDCVRQLGFERGQGETISNFLSRIVSNAANGVDLEPVVEILALHYRYRFDPKGLSPIDRQALRVNVQNWLTAQARRSANGEKHPPEFA